MVSDTHGYFDPLLSRVFSGVRLILHAGDVGSWEVLQALGQIAPVFAVRGNVDGPNLELPPSREMEILGVRAEMIHILPFPATDLGHSERNRNSSAEFLRIMEKRRENFKPETRLVIFGHTHSPLRARLGDCLFLNPGAAGKKRFRLPRTCSLLEIREGEIRAQLISLEERGQPMVWKGDDFEACGP